MTILTIELRDDTYRQLRELAEARGMSLDLLIENLGSAALEAHGSESRFRAFASEASAARARTILDRLDQAEQKAS
jgi:hypothetical protein